MDNKQLFAKNLKTARVKAGLSQVKLAEMLSYTGKAISKWESGYALPPAEILPKLAKILDVRRVFCTFEGRIRAKRKA